MSLISFSSARAHVTMQKPNIQTQKILVPASLNPGPKPPHLFNEHCLTYMGIAKQQAKGAPGKDYECSEIF